MEPLRYLALYAEALPPALRSRRAPPTLPTLVDRHFHLSVEADEAPPLPLPQLYAAGVECGHMEARVELKRRVTEVDEQLEAFRIVRDRAQGDKQQLASDLLGAQRTIECSSQQRSGRAAYLGKRQRKQEWTVAGGVNRGIAKKTQARGSPKSRRRPRGAGRRRCAAPVIAPRSASPWRGCAGTDCGGCRSMRTWRSRSCATRGRVRSPRAS